MGDNLLFFIEQNYVFVARRSTKPVNPSVIAIPIVVATTLIVVVVLCITIRKKKLSNYWKVKFTSKS